MFRANVFFVCLACPQRLLQLLDQGSLGNLDLELVVGQCYVFSHFLDREHDLVLLKRALDDDG